MSTAVSLVSAVFAFVFFWIAICYGMNNHLHKWDDHTIEEDPEEEDQVTDFTDPKDLAVRNAEQIAKLKADLRSITIEFKNLDNML